MDMGNMSKSIYRFVGFGLPFLSVVQGLSDVIRLSFETLGQLKSLSWHIKDRFLLVWRMSDGHLLYTQEPAVASISARLRKLYPSQSHPSGRPSTLRGRDFIHSCV